MSSSWKALSSVLVLAAALVAGSCGDALVAPANVAGPPRSDLIDNGLSQVTAPQHGAKTVSVVIGAFGGILEGPTAKGRHFGYTLVVPPGTVRKPTTFTMTVVAGQTYAVELSATQDGANVGDKLKHDVSLSISYLDSPSLDRKRQVKVYYLPEGKSPQAMPSYSIPELGYVVGLLPHFSRYSIAFD